MSGKGALSFFTAVNAANGDGNTSGDQILTSVITVQEAIASSTSDVPKQNTLFSSFLNGNNLNLSFYSNSLSLFYLQVIDLKGNVVLAKHVNGNIGENNAIVTLDNELSAGIYIIKLSDFKQNFESKIIK